MRCSSHFLSQISFHFLSVCDPTGVPVSPCRHPSQQHHNCSKYAHTLVFNPIHGRILNGHALGSSSKGYFSQRTRLSVRTVQAEIYIIIRSFGYHGNMPLFFFSPPLPHTPGEDKKNVYRCAVFQPCFLQTLLLQANPAFPPGPPGDPQWESTELPQWTVTGVKRIKKIWKKGIIQSFFERRRSRMNADTVLNSKIQGAQYLACLEEI